MPHGEREAFAALEKTSPTLWVGGNAGSPIWRAARSEAGPCAPTVLTASSSPVRWRHPSRVWRTARTCRLRHRDVARPLPLPPDLPGRQTARLLPEWEALFAPLSRNRAVSRKSGKRADHRPSDGLRSAYVRTWQSAPRSQPTSARDRTSPPGSVGRPTAGRPAAADLVSSEYVVRQGSVHSGQAPTQSRLSETEPPPGPHRRPDPIWSPLKGEPALWRALLGDEIEPSCAPLRSTTTEPSSRR